jgi:hypothetical protein
MIERTPPPERIAGIRRRHPAGQQKLFDTAEQEVIKVDPESPEPTPPADVETVGKPG